MERFISSFSCIASLAFPFASLARPSPLSPVPCPALSLTLAHVTVVLVSTLPCHTCRWSSDDKYRGQRAAL